MKPLLILLATIACLHAGDAAIEPQPAAQPAFWTPQALDDWPALIAEAKAFVERTRKTRFFCRFGDSVTRNHADFIPYPPQQMENASQIIINQTAWKDGANGMGRGVGVGQTVVWRGEDGKAMAASIRFSFGDIAMVDASLLPDPAPTRAAFVAQFAAATPSVGAWTVVDDQKRRLLYATWSRPGSSPATLDTRLGKAPPLTDEDRVWLEGPPAPMGIAAAPEPLADDVYAVAVGDHPRVAKALARFAAGIPMRAAVIDGLMPKGVAEQLGWRVGDVVLSLNGEDIPSNRLLGHRSSMLNDQPRRFRLTRAGGTPFETVVEPVTDPKYSKLVGFTSRDQPVDPGLAVLGCVADVALHRDLAVAFYGHDQPRLVATALHRLAGRLAPEVERFVQAWQAAAAGDCGRVASLAKGGEDPRLAEASDYVATTARQRAGRLLWMRPDFAKDASGEILLRHLMHGNPAAELRPLFATGQLPEPAVARAGGTIAGVDGNARQLLRSGAATLRCTEKKSWQEAALIHLPERCEMTVRFTIADAAYAQDHGSAFFSYLDHSLIIGFQRRGNTITPAGFGGVRIHSDGTVQIADPSLDPQKHYEWWTIPMRVAVDGTTVNTLRIIRWRQAQRIEINGICAMQGFLPRVDSLDGKAQIGLLFDAKGVVAGLSDATFLMPASEVQAPQQAPAPPPAGASGNNGDF